VSTTRAEYGTLVSQNAAAFAAWSRVYDTQANPLLVLEERFLRRLLPSVDGKDILDVGCGTGRWLEYFSHRGTPRSLWGVDSSDDMLAVARRKSLADASLLQTQLPLLPLSSDSIDLALASFVLSYIPDIGACARELARVLRDDADLFIADMHPETAIELGWQRGFSSSHGAFHLHNDHRSVENTVQSMARHGFRLVASYQPSFGEPEHSIFVSHGKESSYLKTDGRPAIYLLHFKRDATTATQADILLGNGHCVLGSGEVALADLVVQNKCFASIHSAPARSVSAHRVDLSGYTLFPGLINAHDHLEFALFPRLGTPPYANAAEWAHDIQQHCRDIIATHKQVPKAVRLWWGALRNLLCGVTSVCHHNPSHPVFKEAGFPIKIVTEFGWEHSLTFSNDVAAAHRKTHSLEPFILHACEGIDATARSEFEQLQKMNIIDERTVVVHGLGMSSSEVGALNRQGASLISCPSSNQFLFHEAPSPDYLEAVQRLAVGSDSPLTATGDLLDEINFCTRQFLLSPEKLFDCVTQEPARILRLRRGEGCISPGCPADAFAVRSSSTLTPAQHLTSLSWRDVELVIVNGCIRLASAEMLGRLPSQLSRHLSCVMVDGVPRWVDAPVSMLFQSAAKVLGTANVFLGGRTLSVLET
jgi:cytosine/adenosine deaminase-related metal-dependent hydrolase/ubiquinone/menaquinone biosynthesis C-methylase UbiE